MTTLHTVRDPKGVMFAKISAFTLQTILQYYETQFGPKYLTLAEDVVITTDKSTKMYLWAGTRISIKGD